MTNAWRVSDLRAMTYTHLILGLIMLTLALTFFARAKKAADGVTERNSRLAGALFAVAGVAFFVAFGLSVVTAR